MTENDPREDPTHPPPFPNNVPPATPFATPLDYGRAPAKTGVLPIPSWRAIGCLGYILLSLLWFIGAPMMQSNPEGWSNRPFWIAIGGWVAMTIGLLGLTLWLRIRSGYKGHRILTAIGSGALLVGGLTLLIAATCGHKF